MNQLEYLPGIAGQSVQLDGPSAFVGIAEEMRSREWDYDLGYRDLVTATRPARTVDVTFHADYDTADTLRRVADADVMARTPGTFVAQQEWKQRGYILASDVDDIHYGRLSTGLKIALLDGAWWRLVKRSFVPEITTPEYRSATGLTVTASGASGAPLHALTVDGKSVQDGTPTPDAPVDIQVVQGGNLQTYPTTGSRSQGNVTIEHTSSRIDNVTLSAAATANVWSFSTAEITSNLVQLEAGTYTASCPSGFKLMVRSYDGTTWVNIAANVSSPYTFTLTEAISVSTFYSVPNGTAAGTYEGWVQLEAGSTATPYVPYGSIGIVIGGTATPIDLQGNVLASLPNGTKDVITVDSAGHCVLEKNVGAITFNGSESEKWAVQSNGNRIAMGPEWPWTSEQYPKPNASASATGNVYCNAFASSSPIALANGGIGIAINNASYGIGFAPLLFGDGSGSMTVEAWMTWLQSNTITAYYPLLAPQTIDLGYIDMPTIPLDAQISVTAAVTPTITAEWQISRDAYLDYPHNYEYDYQKTSSTADVTPSVLTPSDVYLAVFGPAVNPYVIVGENRYQVNVTVPAGGYLVVDGRDKTIQLTLADGTVQNVFSSGVRGGGAGGGSYIFEKVPAGTSEVTYDGSFGFDLGWYEEEGEPPWSQS